MSTRHLTASLAAPAPRPAARPAVRPNPRPQPRVPAPDAAVGSAARPAGRPGRGTIVRRRVVVVASAVAVAGVALALGFGVGQAGAEIDGPLPATPAYVVQPGDTLWAIAERLAPGVDTPRAVAELRRAAGGADLTPGQRITVPAGLR